VFKSTVAMSISWNRRSTCCSGSHCNRASLITASINEDVLCDMCRELEWQTHWTHVHWLSYCVTFAESEPYCHSYHDWSITTKFGRQVYTCPQTRVSLFLIPYLPYSRCQREKYAKFRLRVFLSLRTWRIVPYDLYKIVVATYIRVRIIFRST